MYKILIEIGKKILGTNSKKIADDLIRQGGKRISKAPEGKTVSPAPTTPNPRSPATGKFAKAQPPSSPKPTSPNPRSGKATKPATQTKKSTEVATPKGKSVPEKVTVTPKKASGSTSNSKTPTMPKSMVNERPNFPPRSKTSKPALTRDMVRPDAPEIDTTPPKGTTTTSGPSSRPNNRPSTKTTTSGPSSRPNNKPTTKTQPKATPAKAKPKPQTDPLAGWSDPRRKALASSKIGQDAGDGMKWVVGANSNALVRTRDESKVSEQLRLQKLLKK